MPIRCFNQYGGQPGDQVWFNTDHVVMVTVGRDAYYGGRPVAVGEEPPRFTAVTIQFPNSPQQHYVQISDPPEAIFNNGPE